VRVYATVDDLEDELAGQATPTNPDRLLALASTKVDEMLRGAVYTVDLNGLPTDTAVAALLRRATVLQAVWMGDDPDGKLDDATALRTTSTQVNRGAQRPKYAPRAVEVLMSERWTVAIL
jgi:hypothetical protein